ncbi:MAG: DUF4249 domain-containing protein [Puia sp.]|nr:DUF4249 domain-containing protein [Puia sp.]
MKNKVFCIAGLFFTGCLFCGLQGCKKVISVDLKEVPPRIVIEGNITDLRGPYQVMISQTVNFSADNTFPPVSGAEVRITDSTASVSETLTESAPGLYTTSLLQGFPGHTYGLDVKSGGRQYTASSKMPQPVELDSVNFSQDIDLGGNTIIEAVVNFQDPVGLGNSYQFTEIINGKRLDRIFVFDDRLSDGRTISEILFTDSAYLQIGDSLEVQLFCVDPKIYNYFYALSLISADNNSTQSATPANPVSNLGNGALGYFSAHTVFSRSGIVD